MDLCNKKITMSPILSIITINDYKKTKDEEHKIIKNYRVLDIEKIAKRLPLDSVEIDKTHHQIINLNKDGISQIRYYDATREESYCNPPGIPAGSVIPEGCICLSCEKSNNSFHKKNCSNPVWSNVVNIDDKLEICGNVSSKRGPLPKEKIQKQKEGQINGLSIQYKYKSKTILFNLHITGEMIIRHMPFQNNIRKKIIDDFILKINRIDNIIINPELWGSDKYVIKNLNISNINFTYYPFEQNSGCKIKLKNFYDNHISYLENDETDDILVKDINYKIPIKGLRTRNEILISLLLKENQHVVKITIYESGFIQIFISQCNKVHLRKNLCEKITNKNITNKDIELLENWLMEYIMDPYFDDEEEYIIPPSKRPKVSKKLHKKFYQNVDEAAPITCNNRKDVILRPNPYSFYGKCSKGYFIFPGGNDRGDSKKAAKLHEPCCSKITQSNKNIVMNYIINGFPQNNKEKEEYNVGDNDVEDKKRTLTRESRIYKGIRSLTKDKIYQCIIKFLKYS